MISRHGRGMMFYMNWRQKRLVGAMILAAVVVALPVSAAPTESMREAAAEIARAFAAELEDTPVETGNTDENTEGNTDGALADPEAVVGSLAERLERLVEKCDWDALDAARRVGPRAIVAMEQASDEDGPTVAKLIAHHGESGLRLARQPGSVKLFRQFGDDAVAWLLEQAGPTTNELPKDAAAASTEATTQPASAPLKITFTTATSQPASRPTTRPAQETNWPLAIGLCIAVTLAWLTLRIWLLIRKNRRLRKQTTPWRRHNTKTR